MTGQMDNGKVDDKLRNALVGGLFYSSWEKTFAANVLLFTTIKFVLATDL